MTRVVVHVDRLVLKGFRHEDRYAIAQGLRRELGRLIAEPSDARGLTFLRDATRPRQFRIAPGTPAAEIGARAAGRIAGEVAS